ncbi:MAG: hypothetical protein LBH80_04735 [Prevotellaceae bacterium]|nr:hypothetical protein [Prevotellaceae bacterium]
MKKIAFIIFIIFSTLSCSFRSDYSASFDISNKSQYELSEVKLYVEVGKVLLDSIDLNTVQSGASISTVLFQNELPNSDGGFYLRFKQNNNIVGHEFDYFTNGILLAERYEITITDDEVTVNTTVRSF